MLWRVLLKKPTLLTLGGHGSPVHRVGGVNVRGIVGKGVTFNEEIIIGCPRKHIICHSIIGRIVYTNAATNGHKNLLSIL